MKRLLLIENPVLNRKEARYIFESGSGKLTRLEATKLVAVDLGVKEESVVALSLQSSHGSTDLVGTFYVYNSPQEARQQLPDYVFVRNLPKEDRKRFLEEERKKRAPKVAPKKS
jgi:ribosomal protein S24E